MEKRTCGDADGRCTACCFRHYVPNLKKENEWCTFCAVDVGCMIYERRPKECAKWSCAWREGFGGANERPDKTGIIPEWRRTYRGRTLFLTESIPEALQSNYAKRITAEYARRRVPIVHRYADGSQNLIYAYGAVVENALRQKAEQEKIGIAFVEV